MKILLLGGNGFIGSHLADMLLARGDRVRVLDVRPEEYRPPQAEVEYFPGVIRDSSLVDRALDGVKVVFHLIGTTVPGTSFNDPAAEIRDNLIPTVELFKKINSAGVKKVIFLSSGGTVYGDPLVIPTPETQPVQPICPYGVIKVAIENYLRVFSRVYGLKAVILRPANVYGPRQGWLNVQGVIATFLNKISKGEEIRVWGDGSIVRDYLYIDDLIDFCSRIMAADVSGIYNVGSGAGHSLNEILGIISQVTGKKFKTVHEPGRKFDVQKNILDVSRADRELGWQPKTSLTAGIKKFWDWLEKNKK